MLRQLTTVLSAIGVCAWITGCGSSGGQAGHHGKDPAPNGENAGQHAHEHPTTGPHGGHLVELGNEEFHAELVHDEGSHTVTIYLLDGAVEKPVSADQSEITLRVFRDGEFVPYTLKATDGGSEFTAVDAELCHLLLGEENLRGRINVAIDGKAYVGNIEHRAHDHEGHDHPK